MKKDITCEALTTLLYLDIAYFFLMLTSLNKYEWMLDSGDTICNIPRVDFDIRCMQAIFSFFLLALPLCIRLIKNIVFHEYCKLSFTLITLVLLLSYGGWLFFFRYYFC